jgi:hypothetical protein
MTEHAPDCFVATARTFKAGLTEVGAIHESRHRWNMREKQAETERKPAERQLCMLLPRREMSDR